MPDGAFVRDLALGQPAKLLRLWWGAACMAAVVEVWLVLVAPGFAAVGAFPIGFALMSRGRAEARAARIPGLIHSADGDWYGACDGGTRVALFARKTVVMPQVVFLNFRCDTASEFGLAVTRAGAGSDAFRRLRVRLRHAAPDAGQGS